MSPTRVTLAISALLVAIVGWGIATNEGSKRDSTGGMNMPTTTADRAMSSGSMAGGKMSGMAPLAAGANGTSASAGGLTLKPVSTTVPAGRPVVWTLHITDAQGMPVTRFQVDQTKLMHLIVVRSDLTNYQHIHPVLGAGGRFSVKMMLPTGGSYRAIADFTVAGKRYALGTELSAPGTFTPTPLPAPSEQATADGYAVHLTHDMVMPGSEAHLTFKVTRQGAPVTALQTYLGAYGHLVALRKPNLAYSHVHPVAHDAMAGKISFDAEFPNPGTYRLFLQFRADGKVHTAPFTLDVMH